MHAGRSVSRSISENDFVLVIVHALEIDPPEMCLSRVSRELVEVDGPGFGSRSQLAVQRFSLLESRELPEAESYADDGEYNSECSENFISRFQSPFGFTR